MKLKWDKPTTLQRKIWIVRNHTEDLHFCAVLDEIAEEVARLEQRIAELEAANKATFWNDLQGLLMPQRMATKVRTK